MRNSDAKLVTKDEAIQSVSLPAKITLNPTPKICLVDVEPTVGDILKKRLYDCTPATLGAYVNAPKSRAGMQNLIVPLVSLPPNLHEYDVVVVDLAAKNRVDVSEATADLKNVSGKSTYALLSSYPEQVFNSKAFGAKRFSNEISGMLQKESILIIFASENEKVDYDIVEISSRDSSVVDQSHCNTLELCGGIAQFKNKHGRKMTLAETSSRFNSLLGKYLNGAEYDVVFSHPRVWSNGQLVASSEFKPLLVNDANEVVAYLTSVEQGFLFVLPQITNKAEFLEEFFDSLAETLPKIFPYNGLFSWLNDGSYPLPGEQDLLQQRKIIEEKYKAEIAENSIAAASLKEEFKFLRDMLSESGDPLVEAVQEYFRWLGFSSVTSMDEHSTDVLEEDIQVELENGLLIIEVKGIGGTSKDKECAQISKIKHRRMEERQAFDVSALYVVNHQRYLSPRDRINPPFTPNQIKDAMLDKRGLVTTFQLYNAYFDIVSGLIAKKDIRNQLLKFGLVEFSPPELLEVGVADEVFKNGTVAILNISGCRLKKGTKLLAKKNESYTSTEIIGLQINSVHVDEAENGEIGVELSNAIKKGSKIYITGSSN
ncbi:hypothetical protein [Pseudomonas sp. TWI929]|uniref:hypothetical protein n=1 Tax=Pseudomonas sp. TWI929 TaxID=3136795 RepID=UPI00320A4FB3